MENILKWQAASILLALCFKNRKENNKFISSPIILDNTISASFENVSKYNTYKPLAGLLYANEGIILPLKNYIIPII